MNRPHTEKSVNEVEAMEAAFLAEFAQCWPFVRECVAVGGRLKFTVGIEITKPAKEDKPPTWFVQRSLESSHR